MNLDIDYARRAPSGRPLASRHIDLITDGVASQSLKERGDRAVDHALMSTALSAVCRGMGEQDWLALILDPKRNLGKQARYTKGRQRTAVDYHSYLTRVWERAVAQGRAASLRDRDQYRIEARTLVERWDDVMPGLRARDGQCRCARADSVLGPHCGYTIAARRLSAPNAAGRHRTARTHASYSPLPPPSKRRPALRGAWSVEWSEREKTPCERLQPERSGTPDRTHRCRRVSMRERIAGSF